MPSELFDFSFLTITGCVGIIVLFAMLGRGLGRWWCRMSGSRSYRDGDRRDFIKYGVCGSLVGGGAAVFLIPLLKALANTKGISFSNEMFDTIMHYAGLVSAGGLPLFVLYLIFFGKKTRNRRKEKEQQRDRNKQMKKELEEQRQALIREQKAAARKEAEEREQARQLEAAAVEQRKKEEAAKRLNSEGAGIHPDQNDPNTQAGEEQPAEQDEIQNRYDDALSVYTCYQRRIDKGKLTIAELNAEIDLYVEGLVKLNKFETRKEGISILEGLSNKGNVQSQYALGVHYNNEMNYRMALINFEAAARQGYARAQYNCGCMYIKGHGCEKNTKTALKWFEKAAEQGHPDALFGIGTIYYFGSGHISKDLAAARSIFEQSAEQGCPKGMLYYAIMCYEGQGGPQDLHTGRKYMTRAEDQKEDPDTAKEAKEYYYSRRYR